MVHVWFMYGCLNHTTTFQPLTNLLEISRDLFKNKEIGMIRYLLTRYVKTRSVEWLIANH